MTGQEEYPRFISNRPCGNDKYEGKSQESEMDPGNIRGAEPRIGSTAHGREDTTHTRHSHTDSDRRAKESRTGRTEREEKVQKEEPAGRETLRR